MKAIVTGASSGIGFEIAKYLTERGYKVIACARRLDRLEKLKKICPETEIFTVDLSIESECLRLYNAYKDDDDIKIFVNCAGFGVYGEFCDTELTKELEMIKTNITALHILTKLFLQKFKAQNDGKILNVASSAGFSIGPFLSGYYASKAYVVKLTQAVNRELKEAKSNVKLTLFCPGPVKTEFDKVANVGTSLNGISPEYASKCAVDGMLKGKEIVIPHYTAKLSVLFSKLAPDGLVSKINYKIQKSKE